MLSLCVCASSNQGCVAFSAEIGLVILFYMFIRSPLCTLIYDVWQTLGLF